MTKEEALEHYRKAKRLGSSITIEDLNYCPSARYAVANLCETAHLVENLGGTLRSRQLIAYIIMQSEIEAKNEK